MSSIFDFAIHACEVCEGSNKLVRMKRIISNYVQSLGGSLNVNVLNIFDRVGTRQTDNMVDLMGERKGVSLSCQSLLFAVSFTSSEVSF